MTDDFDSLGDVDEAGQRPAAPTSPLTGLRARRQQVRDSLHLDLAVPRYDPPIYVRFKPVTDARMNAINKQTDKSKDPEKYVVANAIALADCCLGVFEEVDGEKVSVIADDRDGDWPRFDDQLAAELGIETTKAADVVRGLYLTDGDVIATAGKLAEWSGYSLAGVEEREGN